MSDLSEILARLSELHDDYTRTVVEIELEVSGAEDRLPKVEGEIVDMFAEHWPMLSAWITAGSWLPDSDPG